MNAKVVVGVCALLAIGGLGLKRAWPWIAPPPLAAEEVDSRWASSLELAGLNASGDGTADSWHSLAEAAGGLSSESRDLIRERYSEELPLPREALPRDVQSGLSALTAWHRDSGEFETLENPLELHTLQQAYQVLENPNPDETSAIIALASRELRCGNAVEFAIGLATTRDLLEANTAAAPQELNALVLSQSEMVAVLAREAKGMWVMLEELGAEGVVSELGAPSFVRMTRELNMFRWYHGEVIERGLEAESMAEAAAAAAWMFGPERESVIVGLAAPDLSSILDDYAEIHAQLTAGR